MKKTAIIAAGVFLTVIILFVSVFNGKAEAQVIDKKEKTVRINAVGDIVMGNTFPTGNLPKNNGKDLFAPAESLLKDGDVIIGNLECSLCDEGTLMKKIVEGKTYAFKTPEKYGINLKNAGFNVLNIANNHIRDFGEYGVKSTKRILDSLGIQNTGFLNETAIFEIDSLKVAVVGFSSYFGMNNVLEKEKSMSLIKKLDDSNDIVIVTFHGGAEGQNALHVKDEVEYMYGELRGNIFRFCHDAVDAGADVVIGHGPHVPRGVELYNERIIAYSLGNFLTYAGINVNGKNGYAPLLSLEVSSRGEFLSGKIHSFMQIKGKGIVSDSLHSAALLMKELSEEDFPGNQIVIDANGIISRKNQIKCGGEK